MEEFVDALTGGAIWGIGFGLAVGAVKVTSQGLRPVARGVIKSAVVVGDWVQQVTEESRETLQDLYHEAKAEREAELREVRRTREASA